MTDTDYRGRDTPDTVSHSIYHGVASSVLSFRCPLFYIVGLFFQSIYQTTEGDGGRQGFR